MHGAVVTPGYWHKTSLDLVDITPWHDMWHIVEAVTMVTMGPISYMCKDIKVELCYKRFKTIYDCRWEVYVKTPVYKNIIAM